MKRSNPILCAVLGLTLGAATTDAVFAASHREAPTIAMDPTADITDVYAFRNWNDPDKAVFIMNVIPAQEPSAGPNYFNFDDSVAYRIHLDTNQDGVAEDIVYEFNFKTEVRTPFDDLPVAYAGVDGATGLPPGITALDGPGSEGLGLRQRYSVIEKRGNMRRNLGTGVMFAVPSNIGPRTMPDYEGLAEKGIYSLKNGGRVFSGQRDETFYIDLGATFDTLNFRSTPILNDSQDMLDNFNPFGNDMFSGFNVNSIAIEVPISDITDDPNAVIGVYASTNRKKISVLKNGVTKRFGLQEQLARMANPLVNELLIGTGLKDRWNATEPHREQRFIGTDVVKALLKYPNQDPTVCNGADRCAELIRLNLGVTPTQPDAQNRLGVIGGDAAGFPNGRRPNDDVTDVVLRVVAGIVLGPVPRLGDGVNFNTDARSSNITPNGIYTIFPFLPTPHDGRNRRHVDCDESGANPCS